MISLNDIGSIESLGVTKKIIGQYKAFQNLGYETYNFSGGFRFYDVVVNDRVLIERSYVCGMDY